MYAQAKERISAMNHETKDSIASYLSKVMNSENTKLPKNKVKVRIAGEEFVIMAAESDEYIRRVASFVDAKVSAIRANSRIPLMDAVVLATCNLTDELFKSQESVENLRMQLKSYIDDIARLRSELNDARREIARLMK